MEILELLLPIFAIIVTGMIFGHFRILPEGAGDVLIQFAFWVAIPALLFLIISQESIDRLLNPAFYVSFGGGMLIIFLIILFGALYWRRMPLGDATVVTLISVESNTAFVALPILHAAFGHKAVLPAAIATVIAVVFLLITVVLLEKSAASAVGREASGLSNVRKALLNPIVFSTLLGVAYAVTGWELPSIVEQFLSPLSKAVTPCALFAIGMSIRLGDLRVGMTTIVFASIVKLVAVPAVILLLALLVGLEPIMTIAAVVCAAVPTAKNAFILASQYNVSKELAAATISVTTAASTLTLIIWLVVLAHIYPGTVPT